MQRQFDYKDQRVVCVFAAAARIQRSNVRANNDENDQLI